MKIKSLVFGALLAAGLVSHAVTEREIDARYIESPAKVMVALPEGYSQNDTLAYPVAYLLNGHGGNYKSWSGIANLDSLATAYRMIIVCPDGRNSWYWDSPTEPKMQMESYIVKELVPWVDANYRTIARPQGRAVTGFSMGGHGGLWLGLRHPDLFGNAGATSGGVDIRPFPTRWNMADRLGKMEDNPSRWDEHTVMTLMENVKPGQCNIIVDCGTDDFFYEVNCKLDSLMNKRGIYHTFITKPGAHTRDYWHNSINRQLEYFYRNFYNLP